MSLDPTTAAALQQAMRAAQAGDIATAQRTAEQALAAGGDAIALNAFLGMVKARAGDKEAAAAYLQTAHRGRPGDVTIACNLIAILIELKDFAAGLDVATADLAFSDASLRVARYRGFLAQSLERFDDAADAYAFVVQRAADDFESWNNLGNARAALGDFEGSIAALERAVALDANAPPARINLATALREAGRGPEAEEVLRKAMDDFPADAHAAHELYVQLKSENRSEEALPFIEQAVARDPDNASLQLKLGIESGLARRLPEAEAAYRRVIALDPSVTDAYLGLIIQYEHSNREEEFASLIALAEANSVDEGTLSFLRAMEHRRTGRFEEALDALAKVPDTVDPERTQHLFGTIYDRLGRTEEAFAAFAATNQLHTSAVSDPLRRATELRETLRSDLEMMTPAWVEGWSDARLAAEGGDPVFLVGFPRSGTTLLDTILMGHPRTIVMEEQPPLNIVDRELGGSKAVAGLDENGLRAARDHYFREVEAIQPLEPGKLLVDKSPLFLTKAALITRLFPDARFILALRHPCDVVLSCFMSNFRLNNAMSNFLRLEDAAEFYDLVFSHWERSRALLPLNVHTIVYEQLVEDVEGQVRPLFDWLGLDWHEAALDHRSTAKGRGLITTASYSQVTEPIYKRAAGRWTRYRKELEPILPVLQPWIEKFGYSL
jgi:tetratricopeptide (TPR) repeat protein